MGQFQVLYLIFLVFFVWLSMPAYYTISNLVRFSCELAVRSRQIRYWTAIHLSVSIVSAALLVATFGLPRHLWLSGLFALLFVRFTCNRKNLWTTACAIAKSPEAILIVALLAQVGVALYPGHIFIVSRLYLVAGCVFCFISSAEPTRVMLILETGCELVIRVIWKVASVFVRESTRLRFKRMWANCNRYGSEFNKELRSYYNSAPSTAAQQQRSEAFLEQKLVEALNMVMERDGDLEKAKENLKQNERAVEEEKERTGERTLRAVEQEKEKTLCQICVQEPRDTLCFPCLHFKYCFTCLSEHEKRGKKTCPACREFLSGFHKVLLS